MNKKEQHQAETVQSESVTYLTTKEVCTLTRSSRSTVSNWRVKGILKAYGIGNKVLFDKKEILDLIQKNPLT